MVIHGEAPNPVLRRRFARPAPRDSTDSGSDAINVYITVTARALYPGLTIVARAADSETIGIFERAGTGSVVSPYNISGGQMAKLAGRAHADT